MIIHGAMDTCDSACTPQSSRFTGCEHQCVTFLSKKQWSLHAAQGKRHSKWSKWTRWGHLDGGRFDDIITRITLAYVNALHACIRSYECTWIRAHSQFLTHEYANVCIFNVYIAHVYTRWDSCRDGKNRRRDKRARTKDPISSPISTVKKKDSARVSR